MKKIANYLFEKTKDFFYFIWILIKKNVGKTVTLLLFSLTTWGLYEVDSTKEVKLEATSTIESETTISPGLIDGKDVIGWLSKKEDGSTVIYDKSDLSEYKIDGNTIIYQKDNDAFVGLILLIVIFSGILLVGTFSSDTDINWEIRSVVKELLFSKIESDEEDGNKYYYMKNRLLFKHPVSQRVDHWSVINNCEESIKVYLKNKNLLSEHIPLRIKRERQLEEILK